MAFKQCCPGQHC